MKLRDKVAQLFMCGFQDDAHLDKLLELGVGGYILFQRNCQTINDIRVTTQKIYEGSKEIPWISIDQEGGNVTRIKEGMTKIPSQMAIAATGRYENAELCADILGQELTALGINMNLAPVVDININPENPIINIRSFGNDPKEVSLYSEAAIKGYSKHLMPVAKHFPGHGDTSQDSHTALPTLNFSRKRLDEVELLPYKALIGKGLSTIMVSHVLYEQVDSDFPSSMSKAMIDILRNDLSYRGIIMTDCMEMDAVRKNYSIKEAAVQSILAGVDMILYSHSYEDQIQAIDAVVNAVEDGIIHMSVIDQALIRLKKDIKQSKITNYEIQDERVRKVFKDSITCLREAKNLNKANSLLILPQSDFLDKYDLNIETYDLNQGDYEDFYHLIKSYHYIVLGTYHLKSNDKIMDLIQKIGRERLILVALETPYDLQFIGKTYGSYCLYGYSETSVDELIDVLFEERNASGKLPITLKENDND